MTIATKVTAMLMRSREMLVLVIASSTMKTMKMRPTMSFCKAAETAGLVQSRIRHKKYWSRFLCVYADLYMVVMLTMLTTTTAMMMMMLLRAQNL